MTDYFTSDIHLEHKNIFLFESVARPFTCLTDMYAAIIERWNNKVSEQDTTFILGDVSFERSTDLSITINILNSLNGRKVLIKGNHDSYTVRNEAFRNCFESIHDMYDYKCNKQKYILCHYPMLSWRDSRRGSKQLFGHEHSKYRGHRFQLNVGMDCHNLTPISIIEVDQILLTLPERENTF